MDRNDSPTEPTPEDLQALRESLTPKEREQVEDRLADLLDLLGRPLMGAVLCEFAFSDETLLASDLESTLDASSEVLTQRLQELTEVGLLERTSYDGVPPRTEYEPTDKARTLFPVFDHLYRWATVYDE